MGRLLVTIGTDGVTDWVRTPDGLKYNLGTISAMNFVTGLVPRGTAKRALDDFLSQQEVFVSVDEESMWSMLAPHRARWSKNVSSSMGPQKAEPPARKGTMTFSQDLQNLERHIQALNEAASKKASNLAAGVEHLKKLASALKRPVLAQQDEEQKKDDEEPKTAGLAYDTYVANTELANTILATNDVTVKLIDKCAAAGRKFNASRARADVREVTDKVAGILAADPTLSWVKGDLDKLAARADQIHGLFAKAKV